jgi:hypothetical protein
VAELDAQVLPRLQRTPGPDPQYSDVCYKGASSNAEQLSEVGSPSVCTPGFWEPFTSELGAVGGFRLYWDQ